MLVKWIVWRQLQDVKKADYTTSSGKGNMPIRHLACVGNNVYVLGQGSNLMKYVL